MSHFLRQKLRNTHRHMSESYIHLFTKYMHVMAVGLSYVTLTVAVDVVQQCRVWFYPDVLFLPRQMECQHKYKSTQVRYI